MAFQSRKSSICQDKELSLVAGIQGIQAVLPTDLPRHSINVVILSHVERAVSR